MKLRAAYILRRFAVLASVAGGTLLWFDGAAGAAPLPEPTLSRCQGCHGKDGNSLSTDVPRLNGQQSQYLATRLRSFDDPTRQSFHAIHSMWNVSANLSNEDVVALANFFSTRPAVAVAPTGRLAERGRNLYENGDGAGLPACQTCHGMQGDGRKSVPRLAGQHGQYLRMQMESFSISSRVNGAMNPHARTLTHDQIMALIAYLGRD